MEAGLPGERTGRERRKIDLRSRQAPGHVGPQKHYLTRQSGSSTVLSFKLLPRCAADLSTYKEGMAETYIPELLSML